MLPNLSEAFSLAVQDVLANLCQCEVTIDSSQDRQFDKTFDEITIVINVIGKVNGNVLYMMNKKFGLELASNMIGMPILDLEEFGISALSEVANIITGNAMTKLSDQGNYCEATPPQIIIGLKKQLKLKNSHGLIIQTTTPIGNLNIGIIEI